MSLMNLKKYVPWWGKILSKIILSRLQNDYFLWKKISLFEHGLMQQPDYAYSVFKHHFDQINPVPGFTCLELGPGDSLFSAIVAKMFGASLSYLIDTGNYAINDIESYKMMANFLYNQSDYKSHHKFTWHNWKSVSDFLESCSAYYLTSGLSSLKSVSSNSIDFIWSHAVLEHVRKHEFLDTMKELRRIIKNTGACSHVVDLKDHLGGNLDNLRFSEKIWESNFMSKSGFYTNRIRFSEMMKIFEEANFETQIIEIKKWKVLPTPHQSLALPFKNMSNDELLISEFSIILKPV